MQLLYPSRRKTVNVTRKRKRQKSEYWDTLYKAVINSEK
jgi:hypothetical protein